MPIRTVIEHGTRDKRSVAFSVDWPGWSRGAKTAELALETLESYRDRYRQIAVLAGMAPEFDAVGPLEVIEDRVPSGATSDSHCEATGAERRIARPRRRRSPGRSRINHRACCSHTGRRG
jgi:hypothetical protein